MAPKHQAEKHEHRLWQKLLAEGFGTFMLTFASGSTAILLAEGAREWTLLSHALAPALVVAALIFAIGNVSGAHFNPGVSLAFYLRRTFPGRLLVPYLVTQFLSSVPAAAAVAFFYGNHETAATLPKVSPSLCFAMELLLSTLLIAVILGTATRHRVVGANAALPVACTITVCGLMGHGISGASMNPARSFGPAIVSAQLHGLWIYLTAPFCGALLASLLNAAWHKHQHPEEEEAAGGD